jgi:hypothetical protein
MPNDNGPTIVQTQDELKRLQKIFDQEVEDVAERGQLPIDVDEVFGRVEDRFSR